MILTAELHKLDICTLSLRDDGIFEVIFFDDGEITLEQSKKLVELEGELSEGRKLPALHIMGKYTEIGEGVKEYSAKEGTAFTSAEAYVISSLAHRIIGNFYLRIVRPSVPTRLFNTKENALTWLRTYLP